MITVREALNLPAFKGTKLVAGSDGLDHFIKWVTTIEIIEDITRFQKGELIITTGYGLSDSSSYRERILSLIRSGNPSAIAIYTGIYLNEIPGIFISEADKRKMPVIEIPAAINFSTLTKAILEQFVNTQTEKLEHSLNVHKELTRLAVNHNPLPRTLEQVTGIMKASLFVFDHNDTYLASSVKSGHNLWWDDTSLIVDGEKKELKSLFSAGENKPFKAGQYLCLRLPVQTEDTMYGNMLSFHLITDWTEMDAVILEHTATLIGIEMVKQTAVEETKHKIHGELADEILHKEHLHYQETVKRGERLGYDLTKPHFVIYFKLTPFNSQADADHQEGTRLLQAAKHVLDSIQTQYLVLPKTYELHALAEIIPAPGGTEKDLRGLLEEFHREWNEGGGLPCKIGVGRTYQELADFSESAREAENAVHYSSLRLDQNDIVFYDDIGFYHVLLQMEQAGINFNAFMKRYLGELVKGDYARDDLINTLETYLANNGNLQQTASRLFIHRHTLKYRLTQIERKTGSDLQSADSRLNLHLAVLAYKLSKLRDKTRPV